MVETKGKSNISGEYWAYKSGLRIFVWAFFAPKNEHFWHIRLRRCPRSGMSEIRKKPTIPPKMMDLPLVLTIYHFWMVFKPIFEYCNFWSFLGHFPISTDKSAAQTVKYGDKNLNFWGGP